MYIPAGLIKGKVGIAAALQHGYVHSSGNAAQLMLRLHPYSVLHAQLHIRTNTKR